ncbi:MAG: hypothetical protein R2710_13030 [Acidimicrobiales bacterium]
MALVVSVVVPSPSSGAAAPITASSSTDLLDLAELLPNPTSLHPDIARQVQVDLSGMGSIPVELSAARQRELDAVALGDRNRSRHAHLLVVQRELRLDLALAASEVNAAAAELDRVEADLADFALGTFVGSTALDLESFTTETGPSPIPTLASDTEDVLVGAQRAASASLVAAEAEHRRLTTELDSTALELSQVASAIVEADSEQLAAAADVARLEPAFESALLTAPVVGAGFPVIVLGAYYRGGAAHR